MTIIAFQQNMQFSFFVWKLWVLIFKVDDLPVHKEDGGDGGNEDEPEP